MKRFLSVCLSVALLVIFFTISISAETYSVIYVNALGNSENDGQTAQTPVQTLSQAYECFLLGIHTVRKVCGGYQPATAGF